MTAKYKFLHLSAKCLLAAGIVSLTILLAVAVSLGRVRGYRNLTLILLAGGIPAIMLVFCAGLIGTILRFYRYETVTSQNRCAVISYLVLSIFACAGAVVSALVSGYITSLGVTNHQERCFSLIPLTLSSIVDVAIAIWAAVCCCQRGLCSSGVQTASHRTQANQAFYVINQATGRTSYVIFPAGSQASLSDGAAGTTQIAYFVNKPEDYWNPVLSTFQSAPPPAYEERSEQMSSLDSESVPPPPPYQRQTSSAPDPSQLQTVATEDEPENQTTHL